MECGTLEIWKRLSEFPDYSVSNLGRIRSEDRIVEYVDGRKNHVKQKIIKGGITKSTERGLRYSIVVLAKEKTKHTKLIHLLVAETFIGKRPKGKEVNHKDGDKQNNAVSNLEWITHSANIKHSVDTGLRVWFAYGSKRRRNPNA